MSLKKRFKLAVLALCADHGMSLGETLVLAKSANESLTKTAFSLPGLSQATELTGEALKKLWLLGLMAPPTLGALGGWGAARMTAGMNDRTSEEVKHQEMIDMLRQQTGQAELQTMLAKQRKAKGSVRGRGLL